MTVSEFRVEIRLKNNRLVVAREQLRMCQREFCDALHISLQNYCGLETMRNSPINNRGEWSPVARRVAEFHGLGLEYLFPKAALAVRKNLLRMSLTEAQIIGILKNSPKSAFQIVATTEYTAKAVAALGCLSAREREVVLNRVIDEKTLLQSGVQRNGNGEVMKTGVTSRERTRQIFDRAMSRLGARFRQDFEVDFREAGDLFAD